MKSKFSITWRHSKQPRKQRKYLRNAPLHIRQKLIHANLSKELREETGKRSLPVRKGDEVKVLRGKFKGQVGKVIRVDLKKLVAYVDSIKRKRADGREVHIPLKPSNLQIVNLNMDDKMRVKKFKKKKKEQEEKKE